MNILRAFTAMTHDLRYGDAPERQIDAVTDWEDDVLRVATAAGSADIPADCMEVTFAGAATCRTWRTSAWSILRALEAQSQDAVLRRIEAEAEAAAQDRLAAAAEDPAVAERHRGAAAALREQAAGLMRWQIAADDAHASGSAMLADELPRAYRIGEAIGRAGGAPEVPGDKQWAGPARLAGAGRAA